MGKIEQGRYLEDNPEMVEKLGLLGAGRENDGVLEMPLIEAAYFQEKGKISTGKSSSELIGIALHEDSLAREKFLVLEKLRESGRIVRFGPGSFLRIYKKGIRVGQDRTEFLLKVLPMDEQPPLLEDLQVSGKMRKALFYAFVGQEEINFVKAYRAGFG
ncbi:hypothetical protein GF415_02505 [Candidatus Micrarchaeota archaeon]|nr:hypothetical protein [Candidatus Micrarchaeota archaeon]